MLLVGDAHGKFREQDESPTKLQERNEKLIFATDVNTVRSQVVHLAFQQKILTPLKRSSFKISLNERELFFKTFTSMKPFQD